MKVVVAYIAVTNAPHTAEMSSRFVGSWLACPPGADCELVVVCNGGPLPTETALLFDALGGKMLPKENDGGWDIGGFQHAAGVMPSDLLVCCGESVYWHRAGWLARIVNGWSQFGPGMYGMFSSNICRAHMNTTAFATAPIYLQQYPRVTTHAQRYEFEHGVHAFWRGLRGQGRPTKFVTWDGYWDQQHWRYPENILFRGDQSNLLARCNHTDRWFAADLATKMAWGSHADSPSS